MATRPQTPSTPVAVYAVGNEHGQVVAGDDRSPNNRTVSSTSSQCSGPDVALVQVE